MNIITPEPTNESSVTFESLGINPDYFKVIPPSICKAIIPRLAEMAGSENLPNHLISEIEMIKWYESYLNEINKFLLDQQLIPDLIPYIPYMIYIGDIGKSGGIIDKPGRSIIRKLYGFIFSAKHQNALTQFFPNTDPQSPLSFKQLSISQALNLHHAVSGKDSQDYVISQVENEYLQSLGLSPEITTMETFWTTAHIKCNEELFELPEIKANYHTLIATVIASAHHFSQGIMPSILESNLITDRNYLYKNNGLFSLIALLEIIDKIEAYMHRNIDEPLPFSDAIKIASKQVRGNLDSNFSQKYYYIELTNIFDKVFAFLEEHHLS